MPERGNQRLIPGDELRRRLGAPSPDDHGTFVVSFERVGDGVEVFKPRIIRVEWRKLAVAFQALQRRLRFADVAISRGAQRPNERKARIEPQRALEIIESRIEIPVHDRANMGVDPQGLGVVGVELDRIESEVLRDFVLALDVLRPTLADVEEMPMPRPGGARGVVRFYLQGPADEPPRLFVFLTLHAEDQGKGQKQQAGGAVMLAPVRLSFDEKNDG